MLVGMVHPNTGLKLTGEQVIRKCLTITGIHNYQYAHLYQGVEFLRRTVHRYPYEWVREANEIKFIYLKDFQEILFLKKFIFK